MHFTIATSDAPGSCKAHCVSHGSCLCCAMLPQVTMSVAIIGTKGICRRLHSSLRLAGSCLYRVMLPQVTRPMAFTHDLLGAKGICRRLYSSLRLACSHVSAVPCSPGDDTPGCHDLRCKRQLRRLHSSLRLAWLVSLLCHAPQTQKATAAAVQLTASCMAHVFTVSCSPGDDTRGYHDLRRKRQPQADAGAHGERGLVWKGQGLVPAVQATVGSRHQGGGWAVATASSSLPHNAVHISACKIATLLTINGIPCPQAAIGSRHQRGGWAVAAIRRHAAHGQTRRPWCHLEAHARRGRLCMAAAAGVGSMVIAVGDDEGVSACLQQQ
eukprot:1150929-Pelagomonas_calceolata.AAC.3